MPTAPGARGMPHLLTNNFAGIDPTDHPFLEGLPYLSSLTDLWFGETGRDKAMATYPYQSEAVCCCYLSRSIFLVIELVPWRSV